MPRVRLPLLVILLHWTTLLLTGQSQVRISAPRLELHENEVHIYYDILQGQPAEKYEISLDVRDESGKPIEAHSLKGDHGIVEEAGEDKQIVWDLEADDIFMNAQILVKVSARVITPPAAEAVREEKILREEDAAENPVLTDVAELSGVEPKETAGKTETVPGSGSAGSFNRSSLMLQSLAVPGLGLSRATGKPHWLRAVAGYGCIGGAIALNRAAIRNFNSLDDAGTPSDADALFKKSVRQDKASEALALTAIGIWVADAVWTWFGLKSMESGGLSLYNPGMGNDGGVLVGCSQDPVSYTPMVRLKVQF